MKTVLRYSALVLVSIPVLVGCKEQADGALLHSEDSPQTTEVPVWKLAEPLQIGTAFGDPDYQFGAVGGAVELTDGRIVVADAQSDEIRFFDTQGAFLLKQGREGRGPGEHLFVRALDECGRDRVFAVDNRQQRITVLSQKAEVERMMEIPALGTGGLYRFACDTSGLLAVASWPDESTALLNPGIRAFSTTFQVASADSEGNIQDVIGDFPGGERVFLIVDGQVRGARPREFGTETFLAVGAGRVFVGYSGRPEIVIAEGERLDTVGVPLMQRPLSQEVLQAFRDRAVAGAAEGAKAEVARQWRDYDFPESYPYFSDLHADPSGNLWIRSYPAFGEEEVEWLIFDSDLHPVGRITTPVRLAVTDVGSDYLLGVWTDENGVEVVRRYGVIRD